ncbi:MAG: class I SAM-dependent methyltransferase, partial [Deltaproteobacteria bacterium]|nr:class I SAM-dependent methyltransferase [Deltaproteobacteria bacterium]
MINRRGLLFTAMAARNQGRLDVEDYMASLGVDMLHPGGMERSEELAQMCHVTNECHVLDVGCGYGRTARFLASRFGCRVTGIDASERMILDGSRKILEEGLREKVTLHEMSAESMVFPEGSFDVVISEGMLVFVDKPTVLREMVRVCRSGGRIGLNELSWMKDPPERLIEESVRDLQGVRPLTYDGWIDLMNEAGIGEVVDHRYRYKSTSLSVIGSLGLRSLLRVTKRYIV